MTAPDCLNNWQLFNVQFHLTPHCHLNFPQKSTARKIIPQLPQLTSHQSFFRHKLLCIYPN
jgi:hypothetical protein